MTNTPRKLVFDNLRRLNISFEVYEHPPLDTIEVALKYWKDIDAHHCKNLFLEIIRVKSIIW